MFRVRINVDWGTSDVSCPPRTTHAVGWGLRLFRGFLHEPGASLNQLRGFQRLKDSRLLVMHL